MTTRQKHVAALASPLDVRATADLPPGVCGVATGVAVVYNVVDSYGTRFRPGCLDRTKREKLAAGKVKLFADHDGRTRSHIGYVKSLETSGDREIMTAYLFDTDAGRAQKEYLAACLASGGYTGYSIGFFPRESEQTMVDGASVLDFTEVELDEVSNTPRPAVPGADAIGVRAEIPAPVPTPDAMRAVLRVALTVLGEAAVRAELPVVPAAPCSTCSTAASNASTEDSATATRDAEATDSRREPREGSRSPSPASPPASMDERIAAVRGSYPTPGTPR